MPHAKGFVDAGPRLKRQHNDISKTLSRLSITSSSRPRLSRLCVFYVFYITSVYLFPLTGCFGALATPLCPRCLRMTRTKEVKGMSDTERSRGAPSSFLRCRFGSDPHVSMRKAPVVHECVVVRMSEGVHGECLGCFEHTLWSRLLRRGVERTRF